MTTEWVGLAGAAIGAGITLVSLIVTGRRDDRRRAEDRTAEIKRSTHDERREIYRGVLATARELVAATERYRTQATDRPDLDNQGARAEMTALANKLNETVDDVRLLAHDPWLTVAAYRLTHIATHDEAWDGESIDAKIELWSAERDLDNACLRDLGLPAPRVRLRRSDMNPMRAHRRQARHAAVQRAFARVRAALDQ